MQADFPGKPNRVLHGAEKSLSQTLNAPDFIKYDDKTINGSNDGTTVYTHNLTDSEIPSAADSDLIKKTIDINKINIIFTVFFTVLFTVITHKYIWQDKFFYYGDNMKNKHPRLSDIARELDFPEDICKGGYHIELFNNTVIIDGCKNVAEYSDNKIRINTRSGQIGICGDDLIVKTFSCSQITVSGNIIYVEVG